MQGKKNDFKYLLDQGKNSNEKNLISYSPEFHKGLGKPRPRSPQLLKGQGKGKRSPILLKEIKLLKKVAL
jgi:hypothetical protein